MESCGSKMTQVVLPSAPNKVRLRDDLQGRESWGPFIALQNGPYESYEVAHHPGWDPFPTLGPHLKLASRSSSLHGVWSLVLLQVWVCLSHELDNEDHPSGYICSSPRSEKNRSGSPDRPSSMVVPFSNQCQRSYCSPNHSPLLTRNGCIWISYPIKTAYTMRTQTSVIVYM